MNSMQRIDYTLIAQSGYSYRTHMDYPGTYDEGCDFIRTHIDKNEIKEVIFHEPDFRKDTAKAGDTPQDNMPGDSNQNS